MSNFLNQEQIDEMVVAGRAPQKKNTERIKPVTESCKKMLRTLNLIKLELQLKVDCIDSIIAKGNIYLSMQVFCENQKHLLEVKHYIKNWERKVDSLLKKIKESNATSVYVLEYKSEFVEIEGNKSKDGEIDLELAREKIEDFGNFISDNLILEIECLMNDCGKNFEETKNDSWKKISAALAEQKESILAVKTEVMGMGEILKY